MAQPPPPPPPGAPVAPAYSAEPPALSSIRSLLKISKIIALIFSILALLYGIGTAAWIASTPARLAGPVVYTGSVIVIIFGIIDLIIWKQIGSIEGLVNQGRYAEAKSKNLIWAIIGLILGGLLVGILLIIAYTKYDEVIRATQGATYYR